MSGRVLRLEEAVPVPWANGGGVTRVLAVEDGLRVSVADVDGPGPFSVLPGIDRVSVCLGPGAIELEIDGEAVRVEEGGAVFYRGEQRVASTGTRPVRVGNVMLDRARWWFVDWPPPVPPPGSARRVRARRR